jgi:leucyl aminopeptidase (aminopeptidase T)
MEMRQETLKAAKTVIGKLLAVKPEEKLLLLTDEGKIELTQVFFEAGTELGISPILLEIPKQTGGEMPEIAAAALLASDAALLITSGSFTHTKGRAQATEKGVRIASMPTITEEIVNTTLTADFDEVAHISSLLADKLTAASSVCVTTALGTDITFHCAGRTGIADTGKLSEPGAFGNLPAGEAMVAPLETKGDGKLVVDGVIVGFGVLDSPITVVFEAGRIRSVEGARADELKEFIAKFDDTANQVAEFGIGTNRNCRIVGNPLVDEKVFGTIHVACGNNLFMGGQQGGNMHYDMIVNAPTVYIDGECVLRDGEHIYNR